jgi:hypothetical protein
MIPMNKFLLFALLVSLLVSCKKDDSKPATSKVAITYEVESNSDIPFWGVQIGSGDETIPSKSNWTIVGKGIFDTTVIVDAGQNAFIRAWSASTDWKLRIKGEDKTVLQEGRYSQSNNGTIKYNPVSGYVDGVLLYSGVIRANAK